MKIENIHCENGNDESLWAAYKERLLASLRGTVFHHTDQRALYFMKDTGAIEHNRDRRFKLNPGSENSFGRQMGWVCFFDFRNASSEAIKDAHENRCDFLCPQWFRKKSYEDWAEYSLAYLILDSNYYDRLIPYGKFNEQIGKTGPYPMAVPKVETWIADRVPITWIEKVILANFGQPVTASEIQSSQVHANLTFEPLSNPFKP